MKGYGQRVNLRIVKKVIEEYLIILIKTITN